MSGIQVDVQTAANAGMDVCMVGWGFRNEEFLKESGAEFVVQPRRSMGIH